MISFKKFGSNHNKINAIDTFSPGFIIPCSCGFVIRANIILASLFLDMIVRISHFEMSETYAKTNAVEWFSGGIGRICVLQHIK